MRSTLVAYGRGRPRLGLQVARAAAASHGGVCLSDEYENASARMLWKCAQGHHWKASLSSIRHNGSWCPMCARTIVHTLDSVHTSAALHGAVCLSSHYENVLSQLRWRCSEGHEWCSSYRSMLAKQGQWCPHCARKEHTQNRLNLASDVAVSRGGMCLSDHYVNSNSRFRWQCAEGHQWQALFRSIVNGGSWCPVCARASPLSLDDAMRVAQQRGGFCLSTQYVNSGTRMRWMCKAGHEWCATLNRVKVGGTWCPQCASGKTEGEVRNIFQTIFLGRSFVRCRPDFLHIHGGSRLELDGFCHDLLLAFEYNGEQHYHEDNYWNRMGRSTFSAMVQRDKHKIELCKVAGVRLVVIPYSVKDRWGFIRLCLLQWFSVRVIFPVSLDL